MYWFESCLAASQLFFSLPFAIFVWTLPLTASVGSL